MKFIISILIATLMGWVGYVEATKMSPPTETPKNIGIAETDPSEISKHDKTSSNNQKETKEKTTPVSKQSTETQPISGRQPDAHSNERSSKNADETLQSEKDTARYTGWLVVAGFITAVIFISQSVFLGWTVYLTRVTLVSTFRPKLIVRRFSIKEIKGVGGVQSEYGIEYVVASVGGSKAKIVESNTTTLFDVEDISRLPAIPPYSDETNAMGNLVVESGGSFSLTAAPTGSGLTCIN